MYQAPTVLWDFNNPCTAVLSQVKGLQGNIGCLDARTGSFNTPLFWCKLFGCDILLRGCQNSRWSEGILHSFSKILKICIFSRVLAFCEQKCLFKQFSFGCHLESLSKSKVWHPLLYNMSHSKLLLCCDCLLMYLLETLQQYRLLTL